MKKILKLFNWIFSLFCFTSLMAYGLTVPSILMAILGIVSLPIEVIRKMWKKLPAYKILRPVIIFIIFGLLCCMLPTNSTNTEMAENLHNTVIEEPEVTENTEESTAIEEPVEETIKTESEVIEESTEQEQVDTEQIETQDSTTSKAEEIIITQTKPSTEVTLSVASIPEYSGNPYVVINDNIPQFLETDMSTTSYEYYSDLDNFGRCGVVYACIGKDIMPTEERGKIGMVKPSGWHTVKYPDIIKDLYLYNRCHLIGYQLAGENANTKNLITGTRYMNMEGMLPFEDMVSDYVETTGNHVMYRVTPIFDGDNLLASGVQMEAKSVEDNGEGILFNVFCYNVQPGIVIDYTTGESSAESGYTNAEPENIPQSIPQEEVQEMAHSVSQEETQQTLEPQPEPVPETVVQPESQPVPESNVQENSIIANKNSGAFHRPSCSRLPKEKNRVYLNNREEAFAAGFDNPCDYCNP